MPSGKPKLHLGESWVVDGEDGEDGSQEWTPTKEEEFLHRTATPPRQTRRNDRASGPQFVMPSAPVESMDGSWVGSSTKSATRERSPRAGERGAETRRRNTRAPMKNRSPEKQNRTKHDFTPSTESLSSPDSSPFQIFLETAGTQALMLIQWCFEILGDALRVLKTPITYLLAVWLLFGAGLMARNLITNSIYASLSPICRIPGASLLNLPFCPVHRVDTSHGSPPVVEFDQLMAVQSKFEEVLEESAGGVSLPMDMKRGEASIRDLRHLVRYSQLHSKDELVLEFDAFIETARIASYDLQKFNSHVGRAVDSVISTTRWTTKVLDGIQQRDVSRGSINAFISDNILAPFQPVKFTESILLAQYIQHTRIVEEEIYKLITEAQALLYVLNNLEDRLDVIHGVATREDIHAKAIKEEVLSELWTMIGGNRGKLNKMDRQLNLLQQVGIYRKIAYAHVSGTILRLQAMGAGLEDLRERVGSPELLRDRSDIPLSVHIENIQLGIERLEQSRLNSRELENEQIRQGVERKQLQGSMIDGQ